MRAHAFHHLCTHKRLYLGDGELIVGGSRVVNDRYAVSCLEGVRSTGAPVVTRVSTDQGTVYLPMVCRNAQ